MKKVIALALALVLALGLVACGEKEPAAPAVENKVGFGSNTTYTISEEGKIQLSTTMAVVAFENGAIKDIKIDVYQTPATGYGDAVDEANLRTKVEKGDDYGMKGVSAAIGIGKELFEQVAALEEWCLGKTAEEVSGMEKTIGAEGSNVTADADLAAGCTISIDAYIDAITEAWEKAEVVETAPEKVGLGTETEYSITDAKVQFTTDIVAVAMAEDKVVWAYVDAAQQTMQEGKEVDCRTKVEKGEDYGMKAVSEATGIGKELYEQVEALADWMVGKTADEVNAVEVFARDEEHTSCPAEGTDLAASVSISIGSYLLAFNKAVA